MILNKSLKKLISSVMKKTFLFSAIAVVILLAGCRKDRLKYDVPTTYTYDATEIAGQTVLMNMLGEMGDYAEGARVPGTVLNATILKDMFRNQNSRFSFASSLSLAADEPNAAAFDALIDSVALASTSTTMASPGVAGLSVSADGQDTFLLSANGWDYTERIEKGIMGTVFYRKAISLLGDHHATSVTATTSDWGTAFGKMGVSTNYPAQSETFRYWGKYFGRVNGLLKTNDSLAYAFILGRTAMEEDDEETVMEQIERISDLWEEGIAAIALQYLNKAKTNLGDDAIRNHQISECVGFLSGLQANSSGLHKITAAQLQSAIDALGANLYAVTLGGIEQARTILSDAYGFGSIKDQL
jgi:Domain of unknown function (DUF4856)